VAACAHDRRDSAGWTEFLRRYGPRIKQFIRGTLGAAGGDPRYAVRAAAAMGGMQEDDLFQTIILRLVLGDCAAMKNFSGTTEDEWVAYLAVVSRSVVWDSLRNQRRLKRIAVQRMGEEHAAGPVRPRSNVLRFRQYETERVLLANEVRALGQQALEQSPGETRVRDGLIFRLYFDHDLSPVQISRCCGVNLSRAGVEKVIIRIRDYIRDAVGSIPPEGAEL